MSTIPILTVFDDNGNEIPIPALSGKSAYEYAKDGGYTGTEEEFTIKMAQESYSKSEIDSIFGAYVNDIAVLIGGDA